MTDRITDPMQRAYRALREEIESDPNRLSLELLNKALVLLLENQVQLSSRMAGIERSLAELSGQRRQIRVNLDSSGQQSTIKPGSGQAMKAVVLPGRNGKGEPSKAEVDAIAKALAAELEVRQSSEDTARELEKQAVSETSSATRELTQSIPLDEDTVQELTSLDILEPDNDEAADSKQDDEPDVQDEPLGSAGFPEVQPVNEVVARVAICAFDKRDNIFEKGLELLNRWTDPGGGSMGTLFQERKSHDFAYLNVTGLTREKVVQRAQIVARRGFDLRLGKLTHKDFNGDVWLYQR